MKSAPPPPGLPEHLSHGQARGIAPIQAVAQFEVGTHRNFVYVVIDWHRRAAAIIDPFDDAVLGELVRHALTLERILLTHTHWDHIEGLPAILAAHPEVPVHVHALDAHRLRPQPPGLQTFADHDLIAVGDLHLRALHTPGHSAGEACFHLASPAPGALFTGDTLFIRDCGRTDFADGSNAQMFASLRRIAALPPATLILPGHHYQPETASTLARELAENAPLRCRSVEELSALP